MRLFGRDKVDEILNQEPVVEDKYDDYEDTSSNEKTYLIKILLPVDPYGTEYKIFYRGDYETIVSNPKYAVVYEKWEMAKAICTKITDEYKKIGLWVPTRIINNKYN